MAPGQIGAHKDNQIGKLQIFVSPWHDIAAERPFMAGITEDDMHRRELVSIFAEPMNPFISLLAAANQSSVRSWPET